MFLAPQRYKLTVLAPLILATALLSVNPVQAQPGPESLTNERGVSNSQLKQLKQEAETSDPLSIILPGGGTRTGTDPLQMLQLRQIRTELNITGEQIDQIVAIETNLRSELSQIVAEIDWESLDEEQRKAKIKELVPKMRASTDRVRDEISGVLNPEQEERYQQILLQVYGWGVMTYELFGPSVGITPDQEAQLDTLSEGMLQAMENAWETPPAEGDQTTVLSANSQRMQAIIQDYNQQALDLLTPEQQQKLETLKGAKFELDSTDVPAEL